MMTDLTRQRVDRVFESGQELDHEWLRSLVSSLFVGLSDAEKSAGRNLTALLAAWALATALGTGLISGGSFAAFTFSDVKRVLIVAPPILAVLIYRYMVFYATAMVLRKQISQIYLHVIPNAVDEHLDALIGVGNAVSAQRALTPDPDSNFQTRVHKAWLLAVVLGGIFGSLFAILHTSYLLWRNGGWAEWCVILSIALSAVIYARTLVLILTYAEAYVGFKAVSRSGNGA